MPQPLARVSATAQTLETPQSRLPSHGGHRSVAPAWTVRRKPVPARPAHAMRRFDVMWLAENGDIMDDTVAAPALPAFEAAFSAFGRGALIQTPNGLTAVEDLLPGDMIETADGDTQPVTWIGSVELDHKGRRSGDAAPEKLYRLTGDALGYGHPTHDLMLGAGARYLLRAEALKSYLGTAHALAPVSAMADGLSMIEITPISTVRCYHICLPQHRLIRVNGVELETYHPGIAASSQFHGELRNRFMSLFPHLENLGDFGAMAHPRLTPTDLIEIGLL
ncbi:Hint domain-containing protein [Celeribacter sp.]|uniref:Hint domain-containing protein n=1 Tax=Celeribacter sp. TaxID=1890673 RepID=UPI003A8E7087